MNDVLATLLSHLDAQDPGGVVGLYLYGSAIEQLRPDSDIDLLLVARRSLVPDERRRLVSLLLAQSGWPGHARRFPDAAERRPIDLTSLVVDAVHTSPDHARRDFQYGEWLRADFMEGILPEPADDPDVVLVVASALSAHRVLRGPVLTEVLPAIPPAHLREAARRVIPAVIEGAPGDERNALLTMARILVTVRTGMTVSKAAAAAEVIPLLAHAQRGLMQRALMGYLHGNDADWSADGALVREVLETLAAWIEPR